MQFKKWLNESYEDLFGFDDNMSAEAIAKLRKPDEKPIMHFQVNQMMEDLADHRLGAKHGFQRFVNQTQWGTTPGAIRVVVGSQHTIYIERLLHSLLGDPIWTTKRVFRINLSEYSRNYQPVSEAIYNQVSEIFKEGLEGPEKQYDSEALADLVDDVVDKIKERGHDIFIFDKVKKVNDTNYIIEFDARGGGVGALFTTSNNARINKFLINMSFNENHGLIHTTLASVQSGDEGTSWELTPSIFEGWYSPKQRPKEIVETILTSMKYF